jgi:hypothetical protein
MDITLPLKQMTLAEKLRIMEILWDDLCREEDPLPSPDWHRQILQLRSQRIETGQARFVDWQEAKERIRERCSEDSK